MRKLRIKIYYTKLLLLHKVNILNFRGIQRLIEKTDSKSKDCFRKTESLMLRMYFMLNTENNFFNEKLNLKY